MVGRIKRINEIFREVAPGLTPQAMTIFFLVAKNGEMSVKEIAEQIETKQSLVMRFITEITAWETSQETGPGLVEVVESGPLKKKVVLTEKGLDVVKRIQGAVQH